MVSANGAPWWRDAVVYQIYPRLFQDSDGDGVGDLPGVSARLDHLVDLGVDALWLSPIYPSPLADFGYDLTDHTAVDPVFGTLADLDRLVADAHARGLRVLMDLVPRHTSIEHPWFVEHPDRYVWADGRGDGPPNNWRSAFGGPAWSFDEGRGRWYLHSFYPEQPDLDWRDPEVVEAMQAVIRFWLDRGIDGFRLDAIERLLPSPAGARRRVRPGCCRTTTSPACPRASAVRTSARLRCSSDRAHDRVELDSLEPHLSLTPPPQRLHDLLEREDHAHIARLAAQAARQQRQHAPAAGAAEVELRVLRWKPRVGHVATVPRSWGPAPAG
jgi:hypothetical protein